MILTLFGGIGLFLLGMILMTDGLKAAAGDALRAVLNDRERYLSLLRAIDHLDRLAERMTDHRPRVGTGDAGFNEVCIRAASELPAVIRWMHAERCTAGFAERLTSPLR